MAFNVGTVAKSLIAGLVTGGGAYTVALTDGVLTQGELVTVIVSTLVAALTVWATPNAESSDGEYTYGGHVEPVENVSKDLVP